MIKLKNKDDVCFRRVVHIWGILRPTGEIFVVHQSTSTTGGTVHGRTQLHNTLFGKVIIEERWTF